MRKYSRSFFLFLLLLAAAGIFAGCVTTDEPENMSAIPWNSPKGWENGLPSSLNEGR